MSKPVNKVSNIDKLIREKHELKNYCAYQEKLIGYKFEELRKNFPGIIMNEVLPSALDNNRNISPILDIANELILRMLPARYRNSRLTSIALKLVEVLVIRGFRKKKELKSMSA
jgi:hypothetical protein